jgi:hypothetical protein
MSVRDMLGCRHSSVDRDPESSPRNHTHFHWGKFDLHWLDSFASGGLSTSNLPVERFGSDSQ